MSGKGESIRAMVLVLLLVVSGQVVSMSTISEHWLRSDPSHVLRKRHLNLNYLSHALCFNLYVKV